MSASEPQGPSDVRRTPVDFAVPVDNEGDDLESRIVRLRRDLDDRFPFGTVAMRQDPTHAAGTSPGRVPHPWARWVTTVVARWIERRDTVIRLMRYAAASVVATTTSLVTLGVLVGLMGVAATWANVMATAVGTVPSFELNRRWVWCREGRRSLVGQILPFCALSFAGLVVSTLAVGVVADHASAWAHWTRTVAVLGADVAAYGTLWVVQYQLLNRYLFRSRPLPVEPEALVEVSAGR